MNQYNNTTKSIDKSDLLSRSKILGISIFKLFKNRKYSKLEETIVIQIIRSGFSIGANYNEATECESRQDFIHKLSVSKKEIKETLYWLDVAYSCGLINEPEYIILKQETRELLLIFAKIVKTSRYNST